MCSTSFRVPGIAILLIAGTIGSGFLQARHVSARSPGKDRVETLTIRDGVVALPSPPGKVEAPVLSPDGKRMAIVINEYENELLHLKVGSVWLAECSGGEWQAPHLFRQGTVDAVGCLETFFHPSFGGDGTAVVFNHVHVDTTVFVPKASSLHSWVEVEARPQAYRWEAEALGLHGEIIEHPRLSPDGNWLVFYVKRKPATRGVWLMDLRSGRLHRISDQDDKHPVWTPDGTRILFHHQVGGDALDRAPLGTPETSGLGFIELRLDDPDAVTLTRVLLDPPAGGFRYHKHPMMMPGSDLVLFHGREAPGGPHELMARRLRPGSPIYRLRILEGDREIEKAKHPSTAPAAPVVVFVGAFKGARSGVYQFRPEALAQLESEVK